MGHLIKHLFENTISLGVCYCENTKGPVLLKLQESVAHIVIENFMKPYEQTGLVEVNRRVYNREDGQKKTLLLKHTELTLCI